MSFSLDHTRQDNAKKIPLISCDAMMLEDLIVSHRSAVEIKYVSCTRIPVISAVLKHAQSSAPYISKKETFNPLFNGLPDNIDCRKLDGHRRDRLVCLNLRCSNSTYLVFVRTATPCNVLAKPSKLFTRSKKIKKNKLYHYK